MTLVLTPRVVRSAIAIVPQTPDLFEGTLRENVDPVGEYKDDDIWIALEQARLTCSVIHTKLIVVIGTFEELC
jgi:ABC-type multidrug transport system fused ATPase/permease subunit